MLEMTELGNKDSPQLPFLTSARKSLQYPRILTTSQHQPMIKRLQGHRFRGLGSLFSLFQCHSLVPVLLSVRWIWFSWPSAGWRLLGRRLLATEWGAWQNRRRPGLCPGGRASTQLPNATLHTESQNLQSSSHKIFVPSQVCQDQSSKLCQPSPLYCYWSFVLPSYLLLTGGHSHFCLMSNTKNGR